MDVASDDKRSVEGEYFVDIMNSLLEVVKLKFEQSNQKYKENVDKSRRHHYFEVGDKVIVHLKKEIFPIGTYSKMKMKMFRHFKV